VTKLAVTLLLEYAQSQLAVSLPSPPSRTLLPSPAMRTLFRVLPVRFAPLLVRMRPFSMLAPSV
jgi:hypothetical protein